MGICYIVGAGDFSGGFTPTSEDLVIAADGGYDHLMRHGIRCDLLLGDLDSISEVPRDAELIAYPVRKDETDMHLTYLEGASRGYNIFNIYGGTGGREDHTYANYCLLLYIRNRGGRATLFSNLAEVTLIKDESLCILGEKGKHLSLFPFGSECTGVCVSGAEYECENLTLSPEFPITVSNIFKSSPVNISVGKGALLVMKEI